MSKIFSTFILCLCFLGTALAQQQKVEEQSYDWSANKSADIDLKFASNIKVTSWDKNELVLKTIITYGEEKLLGLHQMKVTDIGNTLTISSDYSESFSKKNGYNCWSCDEQENKRQDKCQCFRLAFELMLPKGADVSLKTIAGNLELADLKGPIKAKTISGFIDLGMPSSAATALKFKSVTGEIYTDFDISLDKNSTSFSKLLNTSINGGGPLIALETVSGDIFLRKK